LVKEAKFGVYATLKGHSGRVNCVRWLKCIQDEFLLSGSADMTVRVWKDDKSSVLKGHEASVVAISTICAGQSMNRFATASTDGKVLVWKLTDDGFVLQQEILGGKGCPLALTMGLLPRTEGMFVEEDADDEVPLLVLGGTDSKCHIYLQRQSHDAFTFVASLQGHTDWIRCLNMILVENDIQQDILLASGSQDRYVRVWKLGISERVDLDHDFTPELLNSLVHAEVYVLF
jgi:elongator complex protein 2